MSAKDIYHELVKEALIEEGWKITHDPLTISWDEQDFHIDLGAEKLIAAEKGTDKIAVEVKSFINPSASTDLYNALGQYTIYYDVLSEKDPDRLLYLAMPLDSYDVLFSEGRIGQLLLKKHPLRLLVYRTDRKEITQWIP